MHYNIDLALRFAKPRLSRRKRQQRIRELLLQMGIEEKIRVKVAKLSGGQKQRVAIARALVNRPDIILADEPTGSLDSENAEHIMDILLNEVVGGRSLLLVTHNPELAARCDRILEMEDGQLRAHLATT